MLSFKTKTDLVTVANVSDDVRNSALDRQPVGKSFAGMGVQAWCLCLLIVAVLMVGLTELQERYQVAINLTGSLDGAVFLVDKQRKDGPYAHGDIVAFNHDGSQWGFPAKALWAKRIVGLPGDEVRVTGMQVWVAARPVAQLDPGAMGRADLSAVAVRVVPPGRLFVVGDRHNSLDSRYAEFGFPSTMALAGLATRLW